MSENLRSKLQTDMFNAQMKTQDQRYKHANKSDRDAYLSAALSQVGQIGSDITRQNRDDKSFAMLGDDYKLMNYKDKSGKKQTGLFYYDPTTGQANLRTNVTNKKDKEYLKKFINFDKNNLK
jgi:hypothetical protein